MVSLNRSYRPELVRALLPSSERSRVESYVVDDCGHGTDVFGTKPDGLALAYAVAYWMHRYYFRVWSSGHEHIPTQGAAVLVGNHSGVLPFDAIMLTADTFRFTDPPRLIRYMVDYFAYRLPYIGTFFRSLGQIPGTRRNFDGLIEEGHIIGIFPEGAQALGKQRNAATSSTPSLPDTSSSQPVMACQWSPSVSSAPKNSRPC